MSSGSGSRTERDLAAISVGKRVQLVSPAAPESMAIGEVTSINPQISLDSRAVGVTVEFDNPGGWLPGASTDATLVVQSKPRALTVPPTSIVNRDDRSVVFVVSDGRAQARPVDLGWPEVEWIEIVSGLSAGDLVVVEGAAQLDDGSPVEVGD